MTKKEKKTLFKFMAVCATIPKNDLLLLYCACKDVYISKVLKLDIYKIPVDFKFYATFYYSVSKLSFQELTIVYATVARACYMRKVKGLL